LFVIRSLPALALGATLAGCGGPAAEAPMSGYAEAELIYLAPTAAGVLRSVAVSRGDAVRRGQPVFALDADAEVLGSRAADARRQRAEAQAADLRKGKRPNELAAIDQQLAQARAALVGSAAALQRQQRLVEQGFVAALRLDELVAARDRDAARVLELQAGRALALEAARSDAVAAAAAEARGGSADFELARWREGQRQRSAPTDAVVFDVMARAGEWVNAGTPVVALLPPTALKVRFFVPEAELSRAAIGSDVRLSCDGCAAGLTARIRWVSPQAEFTPPVIYSVGTRSKLVFMVEAQPDAGTALKPGQPLDVRWAAAPG
jgi:HlyD family secretion protein